MPKKPSLIVQPHYNEMKKLLQYLRTTLYASVCLALLPALLCSCGKQAHISISSEPPGAGLWDEDELLGHTPLRLALPLEGSRQLAMRYPGCKELTLTLERPESAGEQSIMVELQALDDRSYTLFCSSKPEGAELFLNNEYRGRTPLELAGLSAGQYEVVLRLKEREEVSRSLYLSSRSPERSNLHMELPSQLVGYYRKQLAANENNLHHYADLGHQLILEGELAEASNIFRLGLEKALSGQGKGEAHRLWSEVDRVISKQYNYGDQSVVRRANELLLNMFREIKKAYPAPGTISFYTNYAACADLLNSRQEAQDIFDEAWKKWPQNKVLEQMKKRHKF